MMVRVADLMGFLVAISQLAQTTMRSEIGGLTLDQSLKERAMLNLRITQAVNAATSDWGVRVMRCKHFLRAYFVRYAMFVDNLS